MTPTARARLFVEENGECYLCGRKVAPGERWHAEHVLMKVYGGTELRVAHIDCHAGKTRRDIQELRHMDRAAKRAAGIKRKSKFQNSRDGKYKTSVGGRTELRR